MAMPPTTAIMWRRTPCSCKEGIWLAALLSLATHFLSSNPVDAASFEKCTPAFIVSSTSLSRSAASTSTPHFVFNEGGLEEAGGDEEDRGITRRQLFRSTAIAAAASLVAKPSSAFAAITGAAATKKSVVSNTLCDPSVSTWLKTYDDNAMMRTVHILGTAHISSSSAELAGRMVRDLRPDVVFVELDAKRVARAIPGGIKGDGVDGGRGARTQVVGDADGATSSGLITDNAPYEGKEPTASVTVGSAVASTPDGASNNPKRSNPFDVQSRLVNVGSKYVGNAVKGMYGKLESEGFKAGDEFAMSVREGIAIGSTIVLGDRDVEVTLRRLTQALTKTDIRKLLAADSEVNSSMEELLPEGMKNQLKQSSSSGGGNGSSSTSVTSMGIEDVAIDKGEFQTFVETMKAKENVKKIMRGLQSTAPEIYEAMVAERDVYMARGLDELALNLKDKSVGNTVAVMGMAHVDGVERYLASKGWKEISYPCPDTR